MTLDIFGWDDPQEKPVRDFSDKSIQKYMEGHEASEITTEGVNQLLADIESLRGSGRDSHAKSACTYLRFALGDVRPEKLSQAECYHRAANDLRSADALDKSAQCYFTAAVVAFKSAPDQYPADPQARKSIDKAITLALRSAGRAKAQFVAIGVDDAADEAHRLQQEILRKRYHLEGRHLRHILLVWRVVTGYGTSVRSWVSWLGGSLTVFALTYWALHATDALALANGASFTAVITPIYLAILNMAAFGAYTQIVPGHWLTEVVLVVQAIVSFILVGTGLTFLTRK